ncbi:MAG: hypothetical protein A3E78_06850 [Alphaproteobacteria bacterium RIFCSPHIGHO2_12_FULL_63_12]|nr:MAG: hypothetical protein A3E78_06850 [Alphaproteobacteria bacterium RIFCSPHIGHO2_12_FULL_63_12]
MANPAVEETHLEWRERLRFESRRFNAWWEGFAFDAAAERAALAADAGAASAPEGPADQDIAKSIWGEGRLDPGDPAWTMRHARTLGVALKAEVVILGAGAGAPLKDLKHGTRWKLSGYSRIASRIKGLDVIPYEAALTRINRASADGGISFFELHRDADPAMIALFAAELVKPNAPFAFVDFTVARRGARLKSCFADPWGGSPRQADQFVELLETSGFRINDTVDETRAFLPLVARGWSRWRAAYSRALEFSDKRRRADYLNLLAQYAHLWAERFDAIKAGQLQVTRILARRKG